MLRKVKVALQLIILVILIGIVILVAGYMIKRKVYPSMTFIGHASVKLTSKEGDIIYIDPYFPVGDYLEPADYILITHGHSDHNNISLCKKAKDCKIIRWNDALKDGEYQTFDYGNVKIEAVPAGGNSSHSETTNVGYIVTVDGVSVYHAGDTSMIDGLKPLANKNIDYALYTVNGVYTMGPEEASEVADMIGATHNIPIHGDGDRYPEQRKAFSAKGKLALRRGQIIFLHKDK